MLKSLFGDLAPLREAAAARNEERDFASTAILEAVTGEVSDSGEIIDRHVRDLFVTGSPAQAMREHFATATDEQASQQRIITLFDPVQMWAGAVIKALADAGGSPVERLHLRDQASLTTLAMIERTRLPRRLDNTLKVYHADVRGPGTDVSSLPFVLMERSHLAAVIVGPLPPSAIDEMLTRLRAAMSNGTWRCPRLLFMLPVGATWIAQKIDAQSWPAGVQVATLSEPLTSASAVWNKLLAHWNALQAGTNGASRPAPAPGANAVAGAATPSIASAAVAALSASASALTARMVGGSRPDSGPSQFGLASAFAPTHPPSLSPEPHADSVHTSNTTTLLVAQGGASHFAGASAGEAAWGAAGAEPGARAGDPQRTRSILHELMLLDGLIFAALVNVHTGEVIASEGRGPDIDRAALASSEVLRTHRRTLRQMGHARPNEPVDEVLVTAGSRYHILRTLQGNPDRFILAVLDKLRSNLAMTRFRIMEAQQSLS
ncbi:MAG: hypothetical protein AB9M60_05485 [Leptothrix sp. (in: b-proteobacteria)]